MTALRRGLGAGLFLLLSFRTAAAQDLGTIVSSELNLKTFNDDDARRLATAQGRKAITLTLSKALTIAEDEVTVGYIEYKSEQDDTMTRIEAGDVLDVSLTTTPKPATAATGRRVQSATPVEVQAGYEVMIKGDTEAVNMFVSRVKNLDMGEGANSLALTEALNQELANQGVQSSVEGVRGDSGETKATPVTTPTPLALPSPPKIDWQKVGMVTLCAALGVLLLFGIYKIATRPPAPKKQRALKVEPDEDPIQRELRIIRQEREKSAIEESHLLNDMDRDRP